MVSYATDTHMKCSLCRKDFENAIAFAAHRVTLHVGAPDRKCLSIFAMEAIGMKRKINGFWVIAQATQKE